MQDALHPANSRKRLSRLAQKFTDEAYRHSYVVSHTRQFLARQMRAFRGTTSQIDFAERLGTSQSIVSSRLEDPNYGKWTLQTLFDIAAKLDVAVFVRFVDFGTFLKLSKDMSEAASRPSSYNDESVSLHDEANEEDNGMGAQAAFEAALKQMQEEIKPRGAKAIPQPEPRGELVA